MRRLASLLRLKNGLSGNAQIMRGPKKKKQAQLKIQSTDIVNIFKERQDPQPRAIQQYPIYVQELSLNVNSIHELTDGIQIKVPYRIPNQSTYKSYLRGLKRQRCKWANQWYHIYRDPDTEDERKDINNRTMIFNVFRKSKEQIDEEIRIQEEQQALEDDEDDEY